MAESAGVLSQSVVEDKVWKSSAARYLFELMALQGTLRLLLFVAPAIVVGINPNYLGDYLSPDEIPQDSLCGSKECLLDANRIVDAATQQWSVKPCDDFREFSMGNFIKLRALHDRYDRVGFLFDVLALHYERQRKAFAEPITDGDPRAFKIVKNFFRKCIDSGLFA